MEPIKFLGFETSLSTLPSATIAGFTQRALCRVAASVFGLPSSLAARWMLARQRKISALLSIVHSPSRCG